MNFIQLKDCIHLAVQLDNPRIDEISGKEIATVMWVHDWPNLAVARELVIPIDLEGEMKTKLVFNTNGTIEIRVHQEFYPDGLVTCLWSMVEVLSTSIEKTVGQVPDAVASWIEAYVNRTDCPEPSGFYVSQRREYRDRESLTREILREINCTVGLLAMAREKRILERCDALIEALDKREEFSNQ